jgi:hypothetical protein
VVGTATPHLDIAALCWCLGLHGAVAYLLICIALTQELGQLRQHALVCNEEVVLAAQLALRLMCLRSVSTLVLNLPSVEEPRQQSSALPACACSGARTARPAPDGPHASALRTSYFVFSFETPTTLATFETLASFTRVLAALCPSPALNRENM